jgi:hypothetical protein
MPVKLNSTGGGSVTLDVGSTASNFTQTLPSATTTIVGTDTTQTLTNKTIGSGYGGGVITQGTAVASTSGTAIDFTGIPSWAKKITVMLNGVSTNGTSPLRVQLGTSGGIVTSGYLSIGSQISSVSAGSATYTDGLSIGNTITAAITLQGSCSVSNLTGNTWVAQGAFYGTDTTTKYVAGSVSLSGTLDRIRITAQNGTNTFDAGTINIQYEG